MRFAKYVCLCLIVPLGAQEELIETDAAEERAEFTLLQISERVRGHSELIQAQKQIGRAHV